MDEFEKIYREYFTDVYRYMIVLAGNAELAEEITAETFFRALRSMDSFRSQSSLRVWLCQIAKNIYYDEKRKQRHIAQVDEDDLYRIRDSRPDGEAMTLLRDETRRMLEEAEKLREPYRTVLLMKLIGEKGYPQIAAYYRKTPNWAYVTYHRARKMIQEAMKDYEE
ncbi:MAG: sigma-70 family RNA polymerase sigma factor [Solobacterium sp.]|nr:sigma-70 family RNA polymerase sigma factor [Solobacterium sp.]